jgi:hypothetical protein
MAKTKRKKIPKIAKRYFKILKGKGRGKGEGLTLTAGLTKGQGLVKTDPNISLKPIKNKKSKVYKTIFANQGTKENTMKYPKTTGSFRINPNDTLSSISKMTGKSIKEIMEMNKDITNPNNIRAGAGLKGLGKRSDYADFAKSKDAKPVKTVKNDKPAKKMPKPTDMGGKKITKEEINRKLRAKVNPKKPTTNIFKVKKGESTTKAADAKAMRTPSFVRAKSTKTDPLKKDKSLLGVIKRRFSGKIRKEKKDDRRDARIKNRLLKVNKMKDGPKRDQAKKEALQYRREQLNKKPFKIKKTKITPLDKFRTDKFNEGGFVEIRMNKNSKGKGAGVSLRGMGRVVD